jgi:hypothetical protein
MAELVAAAAPLLRRFWQSRYSGNYPANMGELLKSASVGLKDALEDAAMQAEPPQFPLPEHVESALLSHDDRAQFQRHALG